MGSRIGQALNERWKIGARHALFHKGGTWYHRLERFPGALCDPFGYVVFQEKGAFLNSPHLRIGQDVGVRGHLSDLPGYVRVADNDVFRDF